MKLEDLEKRLVLMEQNSQQLHANFNMLEGSKAELRYWIEKLKNEKVELKEVPKDGSIDNDKTLVNDNDNAA